MTILMVQIANPIYDVVFKYLMKDEKVARLLLSAIIGKDIISLEFRPTEHSFPLGEVLSGSPSAQYPGRGIARALPAPATAAASGHCRTPNASDDGGGG